MRYPIHTEGDYDDDALNRARQQLALNVREDPPIDPWGLALRVLVFVLAVAAFAWAAVP